MQPIAELVIDALLIEDTNPHYSSWVDVHDFDDISFWIKQAVTTGTPGNATWIVEASPLAPSQLPAGAITTEVAYTYNKLVDDSGVDAPVALITPAGATGKVDMASASPEDVLRSVRIVVTLATGDADNDMTVSAWITAKQRGRAQR